MQTYKYAPPTPIAQPVLHLKMSELMIQKIIAEIEDGGAPSIRLASTGDHFILTVGDKTWTGTLSKEDKVHQLARAEGSTFEQVGDHSMKLSIVPTQQELREGAAGRRVPEKQKNQRSALLVSEDEIMDPSRNRSKSNSPTSAKRGGAAAGASVGGKRVPGTTAPNPLASRFLPPAPRRPWSIEHLPEFKHFDLDLMRAPPAKRAKKGTPVTAPSTASAVVSSTMPLRRGAGKTLPIRPPASPPPSSDDSMNATSDNELSSMDNTPTRQLRSSTDRLLKRNNSLSSLGSISLPQETPLVSFGITETEVFKYVPHEIESPDDFRIAYKQYNDIHKIYSSVLEQLETNKSDFERLAKAVKLTTSQQQKEALSMRIRNLFALRQTQVEQLRQQYQMLHDYLQDLRNNIVDYLNRMLPGSWNNTASARPVRAAAVAANAAMTSNN